MPKSNIYDFFSYNYFLYINKMRYISDSKHLRANLKIYYQLSSYNYLKWFRGWYTANSSSVYLYFFFKNVMTSPRFSIGNNQSNIFFISKVAMCSKKFMTDNITISKGPMARKKLSREQYAVKSYKTFVGLFIKFSFLTTSIIVSSSDEALLKLKDFFFIKKFFKVSSYIYSYFGFQKIALLLFQLETPLASITCLCVRWLVIDSYCFFLN